MKRSQILSKSKKTKEDEFYTMPDDVKLTIRDFITKLKDKVIYCNCDDYLKSNFSKYLIENFENFHLKKLIVTGLNNKSF